MPPLVYGAAVAGKFIAGRIAQAAVTRGIMAAGRAMVSGQTRTAAKLAIMQELGLSGAKGKTLDNLMSAIDYIYSRKSAWEKWLKPNGGASPTSARVGRGNNRGRKNPSGGAPLTNNGGGTPKGRPNRRTG